MKNFSTIINDKDIITVEYQKNNAVLFSESQTLTDDQKNQARSNIGLDSISKHSYIELTNEDLNTIIQVGWYRAAANNACANKPTAIGADSFILIVDNLNDTIIRQVLYYGTTMDNYYSRYSANAGTSWTTWDKQTTINNYLQTFIGRKTFGNGIDLRDSLRANGVDGSAGQILTASGGTLAPKWVDMPTIPANVVQYTPQSLTEEEKSQARTNIGAGTSNFSGNYNDLFNKPTILTDVVQTTGQSTTAVMSQKAVTDELAKKATTAQVNAKYTKPESGIPKSDLAEDVKTSLGKADTAVQSDDLSVYAKKAELATVATSGSYNDLSNKPTNYVTTDTEQEITGKKTVVTPPDADDSTQIANTKWVLRNYNAADICYRGVDADTKYAGYYKVAEATLPNWYRVSSARVFVQDFESADNGVLNVNVYAGSTTVDGVATASTTAQVGFLEGTNINGIKGRFFLVVRKQSSTERQPIKVELWYRQTSSYQRISATFLTDISDSRGGLTASNKWVKFTRTGAQEQSYFDEGVVDLTNGFVPNGKFTTTDIALDDYPVTEIYDDSTNNAQFVAGSLRIANSQSARSDTPSSSSKREITFTDKNNVSIASIQSSVGSGWNGLNFNLANKSGDSNSIEFVYDNNVSVWRFNPALASLPIALGEPNRPWTNAYVKNDIYISQTSGQDSGITWRSASDKTNRGIFRHYDDGTTENFVAQSGGFLFRPLDNSNAKSIRVDPAGGALYPEKNAGATLGKESQRWNNAYIQDSINLCTGNSGAPNINVVNTGLTSGTNPTETAYSNLNFGDVNGKNLSVVRSQVDSAGKVSTDLWTRSFGTDYGNYVAFYGKPNATASTNSNIWYFAPATNNNVDLGASGQRWNNGYITNLQLCKVINGGGGNSMIQQDSDTSGAAITVGGTSCPLQMQGKNARPTYRQGSSGTYENLALQSDIPAIPYDGNGLSTGTLGSTSFISSSVTTTVPSRIYVEKDVTISDHSTKIAGVLTASCDTYVPIHAASAINFARLYYIKEDTTVPITGGGTAIGMKYIPAIQLLSASGSTVANTTVTTGSFKFKRID